MIQLPTSHHATMAFARISTSVYVLYCEFQQQSCVHIHAGAHTTAEAPHNLNDGWLTRPICISTTSPLSPASDSVKTQNKEWHEQSVSTQLAVIKGIQTAPAAIQSVQMQSDQILSQYRLLNISSAPNPHNAASSLHSVPRSMFATLPSAPLEVDQSLGDRELADHEPVRTVEGVHVQINQSSDQSDEVTTACENSTRSSSEEGEEREGAQDNHETDVCLKNLLCFSCAFDMVVF